MMLGLSKPRTLGDQPSGPIHIRRMAPIPLVRGFFLTGKGGPHSPLCGSLDAPHRGLCGPPFIFGWLCEPQFQLWLDGCVGGEVFESCQRRHREVCRSGILACRVANLVLRSTYVHLQESRVARLVAAARCSASTFAINPKRLVNTFDHAEQTWADAINTLSEWLPSFRNILLPEQLSFDSVASIMASVPGGFQSFGIVDYGGAFRGRALGHCALRPSEVINVPECGMVGRLPLRLPVAELIRFTDEFEQACPSMGLLDGASGIFFGFDTGDILLVDHDERVWFTPSSAYPNPA
jgi:hypothetical protein